MDWLGSVFNQGFAVIPAVLELKDVTAIVVKLGAADIKRSRAGVRHAMRLECVRALAQDKRLLGMAQSVLGRNTVPFKATMFDKSPTANWLVAWHQDTALPIKKRYDTPEWGPWSVKDGVTYAHAPSSALHKILALRIHIDDSTAENGPLRVLPGTHELGVLTDSAIHELSTKVRCIECEVPRGGVLAMRPLIVHASSKSQTALPRRILHIEYAETMTIAQNLELAEA